MPRSSRRLLPNVKPGVNNDLNLNVAGTWVLDRTETYKYFPTSKLLQGQMATIRFNLIFTEDGTVGAFGELRLVHGGRKTSIGELEQIL